MPKFRNIVLTAGCLFLAISIVAGWDYNRKQANIAELHGALGDISNGKTIGGELHAPNLQVACLNPTDLYTAQYGGDRDVAGANDQVVVNLMTSYRCVFVDAKSGFNMDADGREIFATSHGTIALWAKR